MNLNKTKKRVTKIRVKRVKKETPEQTDDRQSIDSRCCRQTNKRSQASREVYNYCSVSLTRNLTSNHDRQKLDSNREFTPFADSTYYFFYPFLKR